ncbi:autolysis response regulater lytr [hydrocarbon metagenome]|uniref:Autolysis response regulater lytr n=1 Tax=hydrocarbon metagenome TaxID=938273 RepID=A0A0W8E795_9ZZZZ
MPVRALIVDDDHKERIVLRYLLEQFKDVKIVGEAVHGLEALMLCQEKKVDIVFLDITMPEMDGLETAVRLMEMKEPPLIAFVTAQTGMAVSAFELGALDYIVKPIEQSRIKKTIDRVKERIAHHNCIDEMVQQRLKKRIDYIMARYNEDEVLFKRLPIREKGKITLIKHEDIIVCESQGKKVFVCTKKGGYLTNYTLNQLEKCLDDADFFRAHQAYLVNLNYIQEIKNFGEGSYILRLDICQRDITLSRSKLRLLREKMGI